jgi:hypothetical protein
MIDPSRPRLNSIVTLGPSSVRKARLAFDLARRRPRSAGGLQATSTDQTETWPTSTSTPGRWRSSASGNRKRPRSRSTRRRRRRWPGEWPGPRFVRLELATRPHLLIRLDADHAAWPSDSLGPRTGRTLITPGGTANDPGPAAVSSCCRQQDFPSPDLRLQVGGDVVGIDLMRTSGRG